MLDSATPVPFPEGGLTADDQLFGTLGDRNGDSRDDVAWASPLSAVLHVVEGGPLHPSTGGSGGPGTAPRLPADPFVFEVAGLDQTFGAMGDQSLGVTVLDRSAYLDDAFYLEGSESQEQLGQGRAIGDINGDGFTDFAFDGNGRTYVAFGPLPLAGAAKRANLCQPRLGQQRLRG